MSSGKFCKKHLYQNYLSEASLYNLDSKAKFLQMLLKQRQPFVDVKKRLQHKFFPMNIAKFLRTATFLTPLLAASVAPLFAVVYF